MSRRPGPPRLARRLLRAVLPPDSRGDIQGDLEEVFRRRLGEDGAVRARLWYWREALAMSARFLVESLRGRAGRGRRARPVARPGGGAPSWLDVKLGLRMLAKYPGLTLVGGLGMAVAIAIGAGFFSFFYYHLYPTLPLEDGERIVALENWDVVANNEEEQAIHDLVLWRDELESVVDVAAFQEVQRNLVLPGGVAEPVTVARMTASGFRVARVPPAIGRPLLEEDEREGARPVVVIGHDVWQTRFGGDPDVLGADMRLGGAVHEVVGVMPEGFAFPMNHDIWTPLRADPSAYRRGEGPEIHIFGRLAPGYTREQAQAELAEIGRRSAAAFPATHEHLRPQVLPYTYPLMDIQSVSVWEVGVMQLVVSMLVVVVALNVAVLAYARTATRSTEIAVRSALGASRSRIVLQLFVEALVLSSGAAVVGLVLARVGLRQADAIMETEIGATPFWGGIGLSASAVAYVAGLAILAAVIVGVLPGLQATGRGLRSRLGQMGGSDGLRMGRTWTVLIVAQVALVVAGLPLALVTGWSQVRFATTAPTFVPEEYLMARLVRDQEPPPEVELEDYLRDQEESDRATHAELVRRMEAEPDVADVTYARQTPGYERQALVEVEGVPPPLESAAGHQVRSAAVGANFFEAFDASVLAGRALGPSDAEEGALATVVNRTFAERILGGASAVGKRFRYADPGPWHEIVGVVDNLHDNAAAPDLAPATVYHALPAADAHHAGLILRLRGDSETTTGQLRAIAAELDPTVRLAVYSLELWERQGRIALRLVGLMLVLIMISVLLLSAAGIYALMSFAVTRRRREIGIRTALGARPHRILGSVLSRAFAQLAAGVVVGIALAATFDGLAGGELMSGTGTVVLPAVALLMVGVGLVAALGPARRGLAIDPTEALREQ